MLCFCPCQGPGFRVCAPSRARRVTRRPEFLLPQILLYRRELLKSSLQIFNDLGCYDRRVRQVGRVLQRIILEPEYVQVRFITLHELIVAKSFEPPGFPPLVLVFCMKAGNKIIQVVPL